MRKRRGQRIIVIIAAGLVLVLANARGWLSPLHRLAAATISPISGVFNHSGSSVGSFFGLVGSIKDLGAENRQLAAENADLRQKLAEDAELRQQNDALRKQLSFGETAARKLIPAEVVSYQPDNFRQFITISRGKADGISVGMAVIAEGSLVGKVNEVSDHEAKVFMVTDPNFKVGGLDQDSRATGTVSGQLGTGLVMDKIAQNDSVKPGDTIITSGLGGELPKGIIIGRIESVDQKDNAVFQTAQIVSSLKFTRLELVFVMGGQ